MMRGLVRNQKYFWYATYQGQEAITDASGYNTGEYKNIYSDPVKIRGNVAFPKGTAAAAAGTATVEDYGILPDYNKVIILYDMDCPIDETTLLWIDCEPNDDKSNADYRVKRIIKTLNSISYGLSKIR